MLRDEWSRALRIESTSALLVPSHGYVAASALTEALVDAARARGVRLITSAVRSIEGASATARVATDEGIIDSDVVVVASGSWSVPSRPSAGPPVKPIRGQLVQLRCDEPPATHVIWGQACYLVPWSDGTVLVGATVEDVGFDERPTAEGVRGLLSAAIELVPSLEARAVRGSPRGLPAEDGRRAADRRPLGHDAVGVLRHGALSQRSAAGAADGVA